jgi:uncharacterized low-complexity protein
MPANHKSPNKILLISAILAGAFALLVVSLGAGVFSAAAGPESTQTTSSQAHSTNAQASEPLKTFEGVVSDTRCGAKHSAAINQSAGDCTRMCVHGGERFALVDGDQVYVLEGDAASLKRLAGERVTVSGTLNGNTIAVSSVRPLS